MGFVEAAVVVLKAGYSENVRKREPTCEAIYKNLFRRISVREWNRRINDVRRAHRGITMERKFPKFLVPAPEEAVAEISVVVIFNNLSTAVEGVCHCNNTEVARTRRNGGVALLPSAPL